MISMNSEMMIWASASSHEEMQLILLMGIGVFIGMVGGALIQWARIPQIVGYISIGVILGPLLGIISKPIITTLEPFNMVALGVIGFLIGGELQRDIFVKFGKQVISILVFEGMTAFLLVGLLSFGVLTAFGRDWQTSLAVAVVLAAICSATDPASTVSVLWEEKARGPLTSMLVAIVALDDALALTLYAIGVSVAGVILGNQEQSLVVALGHAFLHLVGSGLVGVGSGFVLTWLLKRIEDVEKVLVFTVGTVLLLVGVSTRFHLDTIIVTMALGVTLVNLEPRRMHISFEQMHRFSKPIYVLFFVLVGARLNIAGLTPMVWLLMAAYVLGSIVGKTGGSYLGARYSRAGKNIRRYLGFCLYPQGSIAVGLLIMASRQFDPEMGLIMLMVIILGAFILQIVGLLGVKFGVKQAGEAGLNITEEDLIKSYAVSKVMRRSVPVIDPGLSLREVIEIFSTTDSEYYPVVQADGTLVGAITLDGIRNTFTTQELNDWLVALDLAEPVVRQVPVDMALSEALDQAKHQDLSYIPVTQCGDTSGFQGILDIRVVHRKISAELLDRQRQADMAAMAG